MVYLLTGTVQAEERLLMQLSTKTKISTIIPPLAREPSIYSRNKTQKIGISEVEKQQEGLGVVVLSGTRIKIKKLSDCKRLSYVRSFAVTAWLNFCGKIMHLNGTHSKLLTFCAELFS